MHEKRLKKKRMLTPVQQRALRAPRSIGVRSVAFQHGKQLPREYTAFGDDISPPLEWTGIPTGTHVLAIVVDDPDAPAGTFTHWTAWNIPPRLEGLASGVRIVQKGGVEGQNDFGTMGYRGPKPPSGTHRYFFRLFALDKSLDLKPNASPAEVWAELATHTLAWGEIVGTFTKP